MPTAPRVLAVCVNWNGAGVLPRMLACLAASDYPKLRVLVVDNASSDGSADLVGPPARLLRLERNLGYAAAVNRACAPYLEPDAPWRPDYFLILNNDLEFEPELVGRLVECAGRHGPGVYGPQVRLSDAPERLEAAWGEVVWNHVLARYHGRGRPAGAAPWNRERKASLLLGCALLIDREVARRVGPWDERFFMYHEEVDYLYRAGLSGFAVYYCPSARVLHRGAHGTRGQPLRKVYWLRRNTVYFLRKHGAGSAHWLRWLATLAASLAYTALRLRFGRLGAIARGVRDGIIDEL